MDADEILLEGEERMEAAVGHLTAELSGMRSGRASPALVDKLRVNAYETQTPLGQLAQIGCPEPRQILIKPYDASILKAIEKAIQASNLGLNPSSDGKVLRLILPRFLRGEEGRRRVRRHRGHRIFRNVRVLRHEPCHAAQSKARAEPVDQMRELLDVVAAGKPGLHAVDPFGHQRREPDHVVAKARIAGVGQHGETFFVKLPYP